MDVAAYACALTAGVSALTTSVVLLQRMRDVRRNRERVRIALSGIYTVACVAWPVVAMESARRVNLDRRSPLVIFAVVWIALLLLYDLRGVSHRRRGAVHEERDRRNGVIQAASALIGGAWAVGHLLHIMDTKHSASSAKLLVYAVIILLTFVVPMPGENTVRSVPHMSVVAAQRVAVAYVLGLFILSLAAINRRSPVV